MKRYAWQDACHFAHQPCQELSKSDQTCENIKDLVKVIIASETVLKLK